MSNTNNPLNEVHDLYSFETSVIAGMEWQRIDIADKPNDAVIMMDTENEYYILVEREEYTKMNMVGQVTMQGIRFCPVIKTTMKKFKQ